MTTEIIITVCVLLLLAYIFDLTSSKTKIPSVILLLALGWMVKQAATFLDIHIPNLSGLLPIFGTIGLILIVLEGALELDYDKSKLQMIRKSALVAILPMIVLSFVLSFAFQYYGGYSFKDCMVNAIPLCVISSAIAIPTASNLDADKKELLSTRPVFPILSGSYFSILLHLMKISIPVRSGIFSLNFSAYWLFHLSLQSGFHFSWARSNTTLNSARSLLSYC